MSSGLVFFKTFYAITDKVKQRTYLLALMQVTKINRRLHGSDSDPSKSRRQSTICDTVPDGKGTHLQVCRKVYSDTFAIFHRKVQGLIERKNLANMCSMMQKGK